MQITASVFYYKTREFNMGIEILGNNVVINKEALILQNKQEYLSKATAANTRRAYQAAIRQFECSGGLLPATEQDIALYITSKATLLNPRSLSLHLTAISHWHCYQNLPDPTQTSQIRKLLKGICRSHGKPKRKAQAFHPEHIEKMVEHLHKQDNLKALRDSALIQLAYFGAFRRSELIAITVEDLRFETQGLLILVPRSKTDQYGEGKIKALPYGKNAVCPVNAVKKWLVASAIKQGVIFRAINRWNILQAKPIHLDSVNPIIKTLARRCGFDFVDKLSSHSLRRGFATSAANAGADFEWIKRQGGWKNDNTVREYIEEGQLFDKNAASKLIATAFNNDKELI
jgi:site-specific recombinase XerD